MRNPKAPTVHFNIRFIEVGAPGARKSWLGGGYDLTPMGFPFEDDTKHFHGVAKATLGFSGGLYPVPMLSMIVLTVLGAIYLTRTVMGRHIFAFGGNLEASRFAGLSLGLIQIGVFAVSGLTAGISAFLGASFYGSASSGDAQGYELYVIASAVVGGASLLGGKGSALGAMLGALLIVLIRQSIRTLHFDQNYEWIVIGCAIIIAVVIDQWSTRMNARRLSRAAETTRAAA